MPVLGLMYAILVTDMGMDCLRKIGKYAAPAVIYAGLSFAEPAYSNGIPPAQIEERGTCSAKDLAGALSPEDRMEIARFKKRFASRESGEAERSWNVISPYAKRYKRIAQEYGIPPYMALAQAAIENSDYKAITKRAKRLGIPFDKAYLSMESGVKAKGPWMLRKLAAKSEGGLVVSRLKDEREHPVESTRAAMRYLKSLMDEFGSLDLAYTAYWMGPTAMREKGPNKEYFYKIAALADIFENPGEYKVTLKDRKIGELGYNAWKAPARKNLRRNVPVQVSYRKD